MPFNKIDFIKKIKEHKIIPKPGWIFKLKISLTKLMIIGSIVLFIFLAGSILFLSLYQAKALDAKEVISLKIFLQILPWTLIFLAIILLIVIQLVLSRTTKIYRKAVLVVTLILAVGLIGISVLANQTKLFKSIYSQKIPLTDWIARQSQKKFDKYIKQGVIIAIESNTLTIKLEDQNIVYAEESTYFRGKSRNKFNFSVGDQVVLAIVNNNGQKEVIKVRPINVNCQNEINIENNCNNMQKGRKDKKGFNNI